MPRVHHRPTTLIVRHLPDEGAGRFAVVRQEDGKQSGTVEIPSPYGHPVEGRPDSSLMQELQWYLETFLDYPFSPVTEHADRVLNSLRNWGETAFGAIFDSRSVGRMFDAATEEEYSRLTLRVVADDPVVLSWPWEALRDPETGVIGHHCQVERRVEKNVRDAPPLPPELPKDVVNILLVIARPFEQDIAYRSVGRPLVELIEEQKLPAAVTVLRPPTFAALREHLLARRGHYHIVHFDGHGAYFDALCFESVGGDSDVPVKPSPHTYSPSGHLHFELADTTETLSKNELILQTAVKAENLAGILREAGVPTVVLNACQSAMLDQRAQDPFASVAAALLQAGVRNVVAMAYSLYVSGAQVFLPAFYRDLFRTGDVARAVRAGRQAMQGDAGRVCARGTFPLQDWLVPVLYQQDPFAFAFAATAPPPERQDIPLGEELDVARNPYGFVGRDGPLLELERALRRPPPAILIQGLGGVGKTTLARGSVRWLAATEGLGLGCLWIGFQGVRSAEYVINRMGEPLFGGQFPAAPMEQKIPALARALRENQLLIVWDNFEVVAGIEGTSVTPNLTAEDRQALAALLDGLRGGKTKVLITSRSPEDWLGPQRRFLLPLRGMTGEERWQFCAVVLRDLGRKVDRHDPDQVELMKLLGGHPLAMRVILPRLEQESACDLVKALHSHTSHTAGTDPAQEQLYAALRVPLDALSPDLRPLLIPLALHETYVDADYLEAMAEQVEGGPKQSAVNQFAGALTTAGLLRALGQNIFEMHPMLTGYLRSQSTGVQDDSREKWERAFVDIMGSLADAYAPKELHEQRTVFHLHGADFHHALAQAERLDMQAHFAALTQALAAFALNTRDFTEAERLFQRFAEHQQVQDDEKRQAGAYHQLGMVAEERRDFAAAEQWYRKSMEISERLGNERGAASTYHQLGVIADKRRDFAAAEQWYRKSLEISERLGDEPGVAITYHQLGMVAQKRCDFAAAERWYCKAVEIRERLGIDHLAATDYHQLGRIAQERRDFVAAEQWYRKAVAVFERLHIDQHTASTYHQLGRVAQGRRDFAAAEQWGRKSLEIMERLGDEHGAAITCSLLGAVAGLQGMYEDSSRWLARCVKTFIACNDPHEAARNARSFAIFYRRADVASQAKMAAIWQEAGLGALPELDEAGPDESA